MSYYVNDEQIGVNHIFDVIFSAHEYSIYSMLPDV